VTNKIITILLFLKIFNTYIYIILFFVVFALLGNKKNKIQKKQCTNKKMKNISHMRHYCGKNKK
jgi:hypothetical protein